MRTIFFICILIANLSLSAQTIAEKKASLKESGGDLNVDAEKFLNQVNLELVESRLEERKLSEEAYRLYLQNGTDAEFKELLFRIAELRIYITELQNSWREIALAQGTSEPYALWYQPETTIEQLIVDYGSYDYVYIMRPDIANIKISVDSNLPIPRASWNEMLELILAQNGIGIRQLNPFLRELYMLRQDRSGVKIITSKREDLEIMPRDAKAAFVVSPEPSDVRRIWFFLNNFANPENTAVQLVGRDILIVAQISDILDLLKLYDFIAATRGEKEYKAITLSRVPADEMAKVLQTIFNQTQDASKAYRRGEGPDFSPGPESNGLQILTLGAIAQSIFLIGTKEEVKKAEEIIKDIEAQVAGARDKVIYWYTTKHSDPDELAEVLSKVYELMIATGVGFENGYNGEEYPPNNLGRPALPPIEQKTIIEQPSQGLEPQPLPAQLYPEDPYFQRPVPPIAPAFVFPANSKQEKQRLDFGNFIVDPKSGSIVMVVESDILPKIKDLIRKMDIPKKMVQLEVLLFEKRIDKTNTFGLNLLKLGSLASQTTAASSLWNAPTALGVGNGIFDFLWSHKRESGIPAFDLIYRFLLTQTDITINSSPSVITLNQTPAFIAIEDERSIKTGVFQVETANGVTLKDAFQRAQYGTTIKITPTIHIRDEDELDSYDTITLDSDITFDTINSNVNDQPDVTRRNIKNQARVADGETVILGGLRRKTSLDAKQAIPFLGEIPGLGKLFSLTSSSDNSTEMFIFITPKIISDPACDLERIRREEMLRRPGDIPEFMGMLICARECAKKQLLDGWLTVLFGREPDRCYSPDWHNLETCPNPEDIYVPIGEYDGR
ncbi:Uncharacterized protein PHSC3_000139 [Chlamydiales bacterium STE3]|nr:Uncharacterized protein PHSC3_000139 [Chlamydiales bacterium STE3]